MLRVVILYDKDGRVHGRILKEFDVYNDIYLDAELTKDSLRRKREFCLISRNSEFLNVIKEGQLWECVIEREITDRKGNKVKIVKPIKLLHEHSLWFKRNGEERIPIFSIVSGDWHELLPVIHETKVEEYKDEFIHYIEKYPVLRGYCPYCQKEIMRDDFARIRETIYQAPLEEIIAYWREYLGEEYDEVIKMWRELDKKMDEVKRKYKKREIELKNRIFDLERVGIVERRLTQQEREELWQCRYNDWMRAGGDPFEEPEVPERTYEVVNPEKREKALKEAEELKARLSLLSKLEEEEKEELRKEFYENEKVKRVFEKARYLLANRVYPCILAAIAEKDPYFFEFTSLYMMPTFDAVETVLSLVKK